MLLPVARWDIEKQRQTKRNRNFNCRPEADKATSEVLAVVSLHQDRFEDLRKLDESCAAG